MIFEKERFISAEHSDKLQSINSKKDIVVYVHGKGGNASEAEHYKQFFKEDVYGFDYKSENQLQKLYLHQIYLQN